MATREERAERARATWERRRAAGETLLSDDGVNPLAYVVDPETGCHLWQGSMASDARAPEAAYRGTRVSVRRWLYARLHGDVPAEHDVGVWCKRDRCIAPDHLIAFPSRHQIGKRGAPLPREAVAERVSRHYQPASLSDREWRIAVLVAHDGLSINQAAKIEDISGRGAAMVWARVEAKVLNDPIPAAARPSNLIRVPKVASAGEKIRQAAIARKRHRKPTDALTDDDLARIAWSDPATPTTALARQTGKDYSTVAKARQRIARAGSWSCPVAWRDCDVCGEPVAGGPQKRLRHDRCHGEWARRNARERRATRAPGSLSTPYVKAWRAANPDRNRELRDAEKAKRRDRWPNRPEEERKDILARAHEHDATAYPVTLERARQSGEPWTGEDDAYLIEHQRQPARDAGIALGRTLWSVRQRRVRLRRRGLID